MSTALGMAVPISRRSTSSSKVVGVQSPTGGLAQSKSKSSSIPRLSSELNKYEESIDDDDGKSTASLFRFGFVFAFVLCDVFAFPSVFGSLVLIRLRRLCSSTRCYPWLNWKVSHPCRTGCGYTWWDTGMDVFRDTGQMQMYGVHGYTHACMYVWL